ncbi:hypothetical protein [Rhizobium subbaraonis]|uniref:hypothetical protein n=1 Tax=Rhizobium subbaraonis TaxID=908946 RepID=UPI00159671F4|nr:hypothetical protein [Rhizobium subbaraonis]
MTEKFSTENAAPPEPAKTTFDIPLDPPNIVATRDSAIASYDEPNPDASSSSKLFAVIDMLTLPLK